MRNRKLVEIHSEQSALGVSARALTDSDVAGKLLAGYLLNDIQGSISEAREALAHLNEVQSVRETVWSETGNAYVITAKKNEVVLDFQWADDGEIDTASMPLQSVQEALNDWITALEYSASSS